MQKRFIPLVVAAIMVAVPLHRSAYAAESANLSGTYTNKGTDGPITLTLKNEADHKISGNLKGGKFQANLKGSVVDGGAILGQFFDTKGNFLSYFQLTRDGNFFRLNFVATNIDGDPDLTKQTLLESFPINAAKPEPSKPEPPKPESSKPEPTKPAPNTVGTPTVAASPNFAGVFKDDTLTFESKAEGATYSGSIKLAGQNFKFTAKPDGAVLRGVFESPDGNFPFEATLEGRTLKFVTEGTVYNLNKQGNPLAKPPGTTSPPTPPNPLVKPAVTQGTSDGAAPNGAPVVTALPTKGNGTAGWQIYKHPTGLSVRYPPDWKLIVQNGIGMLTPPDVTQNPNEPSEIYLLFANGSEGIKSIDDPAVVPFVEQQMQQFAPNLQRVGEVQKLRVGAAPGILISWEGLNLAGMNVRANMMATILKGYSVTLLALGDKTKIAARESVLKEVFASLAAGMGERDANLVGQWKFWGYKASADGKFGTETTRRFRFLEDGTCLWQSNSESSGSVQGRNTLGEQTFFGGTAGTGGNADRGQWAAANGQLYVLWADGSTGTWAYEVRTAANGKRLFLKGADNKADEWVAE